MLKKINLKPDWLKADNVFDIYSVSGCFSENFADYINFWKHNGYWLFDSPGIIRSLVKEANIDTSGACFFYYEVYEHEYDLNAKRWLGFEPEKSFTTNVIIPEIKQIEGYDVVNFTAHTNPECSPLSCNSAASGVPVNEHCLLQSFEEVKKYLENGYFDDFEPGPYRIFSVYSLPQI